MAQKHRYNIEELHVFGIEDISDFVEVAHLRWRGEPKHEDDDAKKAYQIYQFILNNDCQKLQDVLEFVFQNGLWSAWRRGKSTFSDLMQELRNEKFAREAKQARLEELDRIKQNAYNIYESYLTKDYKSAKDII